jgi:hypothetical protein
MMPEAPFQIEQLEDGKITAIRFLDTGNEAAQAWLGEGQRRLSAAPPDKPLLMLFDTRAVHNQLSAASMRTMYQLAQSAANRTARIAILIDEHASSQILDGVSGYTVPSSFKRAIFTSQAEAVAWLLEP